MSLARALLSGVTESSLDLTGYDFEETASMESYYLDAACESLLQDIFNVDKAFMVADVVGEVQVLKEGADPEVLLEGIIGDAFNKLKEGFKKFLAKIKAWFDQVKKFFKVLFMNGKELVDKYGDEIRKKAASIKGFKYKGFKYDIDKGNTLVEDISTGVSDEINGLISGSYKVTMDTFKKVKEKSKEQYMKDISKEGKTITSTVGDITGDTSTTDYQDKLCKKVAKVTSDYADLGNVIAEKYRNGDTTKKEITDFEANKDTEMTAFIKNFNKAIDDANNKEKAFEDDVKAVVAMLDKVAGTTGEDRNKKPISYPLASTVSRFVSAALAVRKTACDKKVALYKEIYNSWTAVLKSLVLKKEVKESAFYEDFDNVISLTEAGEAEVEAPEQDDEMAGEGDSATKEGYKKSCESASLLESAYNYL